MVFLPEFEYFQLLGWEVDFIGDFFEWHGSSVLT
jgi:hypothetical protein